MENQNPFTFRCANCGTRNRIPAAHVGKIGKCGKCGSQLETREFLTSEPIMVTDGNFEEKILKSPLPALVFCWAPWCPTCGAVAPIIDEFARTAKGRVRVGKVNIDSNPLISSRFSIMSVPFLMIFDNGQLKESMPGGMQRHDLMMKMAHYL